MKNFKFKIHESLNDIFYEKGNTYYALRKIAWGDSDNYNVDIRKYYSNTSGEETMSKGVSLSDEAADLLTESLIENGYGNTRQILKSLSKRDNCSIEINDDNIDELVKEDESYYSTDDLFGMVVDE